MHFLLDGYQITLSMRCLVIAAHCGLVQPEQNWLTLSFSKKISAFFSDPEESIAVLYICIP